MASQERKFVEILCLSKWRTCTGGGNGGRRCSGKWFGHGLWDTQASSRSIVREIWLIWPILCKAAPILIFRAWRIRDTMGWRAQTIACCLARYVQVLLSLSWSWSDVRLRLLAYMQLQCSSQHRTHQPLRKWISTSPPANGIHRDSWFQIPWTYLLTNA